jgi:Cyclic nucleotide-binding domain/Major Facilitator Superfamily
MRTRAGALAQVAHSTTLRRAQLSFGVMWAGEWAVMVALGVVAFRDGGAAAVGVVTAVRMVPAALLAPFAATLADTVRRERVLAWIGLIRAATLGSAAALLAVGGPAGAVYCLAIVATVAQTLYRPAHSALLPALCASPQQLTSANVVRGMLDSLATLGGPLAAAVLLATSGPAAVFAACAGASLWAGLLVVALPYDPPPRGQRSPGTDARAVLQGFEAIAADRNLRLITGLTTAQTFTRGCLSVLSVVVAIDLLDTGEAGVGVLNAAVGAGAVLGSIVAFRLVRRGGLAMWFGLGVALWGAPLALLGAVPEPVVAIALLAVVGIGNALVDVGAFTLPARLADETVMARVFAGFEAILTLGVAAGALLTPLVIDLLGVRLALVAVGLVAPLAAGAGWAALRRLDARMQVRDADIELLQEVPMLSALPEATIEQLAAALEHAEIARGRAVFEQGEPGERFYIVEAGCADVLRDRRPVETLGRGDCFGEIALLRDCVRTATVRASAETPLRVSVLPRNPFLTAVTGYPASATAGERVVTARLEALAVQPAPSRADRLGHQEARGTASTPSMNPTRPR